MAAAATKLSSDLVIVIKTGVDKKGKEVLKKATLGNLDLKAADQDVFDVVKAVEKLLNYPVNEIQKADHSVIVNA
ncbi:DUF1659 domain-containing protein [Clostridiaceae bacterium UIB06]|uniref:DUF1659 domain-containing protein n=1 Tax=Clostridium thailandense TaxID=2794346 RepID=A0A949TSQ8_9CLOT|nr:DUF1659 domain-containing protein [Clostridium thailandense]MBV7271628.1 DUF1659 domain-containing protein [Clostridium thailandense]MCH5136402.1 DUF1659 domain-containing protein [Clostridiaceae bacterium UIB06]